jgi:hypothetical protein
MTRCPVERFREKIAVTEAGCHEWKSTIKRDGYGQFWLNGKSRKAHQVAYRLFVGPIAAGLCVLHKCDNRKCVNPEHLWLGTVRENIADMDAKKRRGHKGWITKEIALAIISEYRAGGLSQQAVGKKFGVDQTTVSALLLGKRTHQDFAFLHAQAAAARHHI